MNKTRLLVQKKHLPYFIANAKIPTFSQILESWKIPHCEQTGSGGLQAILVRGEAIETKGTLS